jgi:hypothetical protein
LLEREQKTGETIEGFMEWFDSDDFRRDNQRIWLKPSAIEKWWMYAFPANNPTNTLVDPDTGWAPFDFEGATT